jgi:anion transporter
MGGTPRRLLAGFMALTAFISMWINNTATTSLMAPIALAVLTQINEHIEREAGEDVEGSPGSPRLGEAETSVRRTGASAAVSNGASSTSEERRRLKTKRDKGVKYQTLEDSGDSGDDPFGEADVSTKGSGEGDGDDDDELAIESARVSQRSEDGSEHETRSRSSLEDDVALADADPEITISGDNDNANDSDPFTDQSSSSVEERKECMELFVKGILLSVAYSASIGGTSTLVGTAPNLVLVNQFAAIFPLAPSISFFKWFLFATPLATVFLIILWFYFAYFYCPKPHLITINLQKVREQYDGLGRMTWPEIVVLIDFAVLVVLWLTRSGIHELSIPGWANLLFDDEYVSDGTVAMVCAVVLFLLPSRTEPGHQVMDWESTASLPWGIVMLMGGGFALAKGFVTSGLSEYLGEELEVLESLPVAVLLLVICASLTFLTELTSNVATANVVLPILGSIAVAIKQSPLLLMIPGTISCSYAFMLPVATPPNAVVFAYGRFKVMDMVKAGLLVSAMGVVLLVSASLLLAPLIFDIDFGEVPAWALKEGGPP